MPLPTLLAKGNLVANNKSLQKKYDEIVPMQHIMEWFKARISNTGLKNRILILKSKTGSGKSTALPPYIFDNFYIKGRGNIAVTQPRVLTAMSITNDIVGSGNYKSMVLGKTIGWLTGPSRRKPSYGVTYMTIGVLAMQLRTLTDTEFMEKYRFIILDECHEMTLELSLAIYMLKNFLLRNESNINLPFVIATSATFIPEKFLHYFGVYDDQHYQPNYIEVEGFAYPKYDHWLEYATNNYLQSAVEVITKIHEENPNDNPLQADIMLFLPSPKEMQDVALVLGKYNEKRHSQGLSLMAVLLLDSPTINERKPDYASVFMPPDQLRVMGVVPARRVILSTSVGETGLTIDTLKYCIDAGFNRGVEYNPSHNITALINKPAPISRILQRKGRVGRKFPGHFYPLYPEYIYAMLPENQFSDIIISDVSPIFMALMKEQLSSIRGSHNNADFRVDKIDLIDMPSKDALASAIEKMYALGFLSPDVNASCNSNYGLTSIGELAARMNKIQPEHIRMIFAAYAWKCCPLDVITIAAYMSMKLSDFKTKRNGKNVEIDWIAIYRDALPSYLVPELVNNVIYKLRFLLADNFIDGLLLYTAISNIITRGDLHTMLMTLMEWCEKNGVSFSGAMSLIALRDELIESLLNIGINVFNNSMSLVDVPETEFMNTVVQIKYCIYDGYLLNLCKYDEQVEAYRNSTGLIIKVPPIFNQSEFTLAEERKYGITDKIKPRIILADEFGLKYNEVTKIYDIVVARISTMDGYVNVDMERVQ